MFDFNFPAHWQIFKLRQILKPVSEKNRPNMALLSVTREQGVIIRNIESKEENHNVIPQDLSNYKVVRKGQFVINKMKAWQGSCGVSNYDGIVSPAYYVFELNFSNKKFFNYVIRSRIYADFFAKFSKGIRVDQWDLPLQAIKNIPLPVPPLDEQEKIVRYLDKKTAQISTFLDAKKKEVALLDELKRSIIAETVTKGLRGDSSHWQKIKLKYLAQIYNGNSISDYEKDNYTIRTNIPYIATKDVSLDYCVADYENGLFVPEESKFRIAPAGSTLLCIEGGSAGKKKAFLTRNVAFVNKLCAFVPEKIHGKFLFYAICSPIFEFQFYTKLTGMIGGVALSDLKNIKIPVPPLEEQKEIAAYLDSKCEKIEKLSAGLQEEIKYVEELKVSIISEVVTGKKDVRGLIYNGNRFKRTRL